MRKQDKSILVTGLIFSSLTVLVDVFMQRQELKKNNEKLNWDNFNGLRTFKRATIVGVLGGITGNEIYKSNFKEASQKPFSSDAFIRNVLKSENIKSNPVKLQKNIDLKEDVKYTLNSTFSNELASYPEDTGSLVKKTAINSTYDSDIVLAFKSNNSFGSLPNLSKKVHETIDELYGDIASVTKNKRATTITFEEDDVTSKIDIVYGKEIGNYSETQKLNLHSRPDFFWQNGKRFKTDISLQKKILVNQPKVRETIKIFKTYLYKNNLPIETTLFEQLIIEALSVNNYGTNSSSTENLINSMKYISNKLSNRTIKDYANSNNNLLYKLAGSDRVLIANFLDLDLRKINDNCYYIKDMFTV